MGNSSGRFRAPWTVFSLTKWSQIVNGPKKLLLPPFCFHLFPIDVYSFQESWHTEPQTRVG